MNKYLRGAINFLVELAIGFVGLLFALNIMFMGFLFFTDVVMRVDLMIAPNLPAWWVGLVPGTLPLFFLITTLGLSVFTLFWTVKIMKQFDIEKVLIMLKRPKEKVSV